MAPPWEIAKPRRRLPGGLTGNALLTTLISAIVSGVISFFVAHQQTQDSTRQAVTGQQVQQVIQLEADVKTFDDAASGIYQMRAYCDNIPASFQRPQECVVKGNILDSPAINALINSEDTLIPDLANISDPVVTEDTDRLEEYVQLALYNAANHQGVISWANANIEYSAVITRCGRIIQGQ